MLSVSAILLLLRLLFNVTTQAALDGNCTMQLEKRVVALLSSNSTSVTAPTSEDSIDINIRVTLRSPIKNCGRKQTTIRVFSENILHEVTVNLTQHSDLMDTTDDFKMFLSTLALHQSAPIVAGTSIRLSYKPFYANCEAAECGGNENDTVRFVEDRSPALRFEVLLNNKALETNNNATTDAMASNGTSDFDDIVTIQLANLDSSVDVYIDAQDPDVFYENTDIFEYSAVSEPNVTLSADVLFINESLQFGNSSDYQGARVLVDTLSDNICGGGIESEWCSKQSMRMRTAEAESRIQLRYSFFIEKLCDFLLGQFRNNLTRELGDDIKLGLVVRFKFLTSIASGRKNKLISYRKSSLTLLKKSGRWVMPDTTSVTPGVVPADWSILKILALVSISIVAVAALALICSCVVIKGFCKPNNNNKEDNLQVLPKRKSTAMLLDSAKQNLPIEERPDQLAATTLNDL